MTIGRSLVYLIGTGPAQSAAWSLSSGDTISNNATDSGAETDVLGDNASIGEGRLYCTFTGTTSSSGTLDYRLNGTPHSGAFKKTGFQRSLTMSGSSTPQVIDLGTVPVSRYMSVDAKNNGTGGSLSSVAFFLELGKLS